MVLGSTIYCVLIHRGLLDLEGHRLEAKVGAVGHCAALACNDGLRPIPHSVTLDGLVLVGEIQYIGIV
jgi:hypothetical protein